MRPSERERRTIIAGALVAGLVVAYWAFDSARAPEETAAPREVYARLEALAAQREATAAALERARAHEAALAERTLGPADPAVAAAALAAAVEEVAGRSGVRIDQELAGEPETIADALLAIPLRLTLSMDVLGLRQFLYELGRTPATLVVDEMTIASLTAGGGGSANAPQLQVQMTVKGFVVAPEEAAP